MGRRLQTETEFTNKVAKLREQFQGTRESAREIYILRIKPEAFSDDSAKAKRTFPSHNFPPLTENPLGYVYVGLTGLTAEERFEVHRDKLPKASKIAKLGFLLDGTYQEVGKDLTDKFGSNKLDGEITNQKSWSLG